MTPKYIPGFADCSSADGWYTRLMTELDWVHRDNAPRLEYWWNRTGVPYTYGSGRGERTYEAQPSHEVILDARLLVFGACGVKFDACFLNQYRDSSDALGWHADDDPKIDHSFPIAVVSLGAPRRIDWRPIGGKGIECISSQELTHGSLFLMPAGMQQTHQHRIPKGPENIGPRISLTFRRLK